MVKQKEHPDMRAYMLNMNMLITHISRVHAAGDFRARSRLSRVLCAISSCVLSVDLPTSRPRKSAEGARNAREAILALAAAVFFRSIIPERRDCERTDTSVYLKRKRSKE